MTGDGVPGPDIVGSPAYINQKPFAGSEPAMGFHMSVANVVPLPRRSHFTIIANQFLAIAVQAKLSASDMKVYLAIAQHADGNCTAWPSLKRIAELAGIANVTHVSRSIRRIEDARLLTRVRRRNRQGKWDSTTYTIAHLEPVTKSGHQSSDEIWSLDQGTSDQIWSAPVTKDGQLNRSYEHSKNSPPPLPSGEVPPPPRRRKNPMHEQSGFRLIGSLTQTVSPTPKVSGSATKRSAANSKNSLITTSAREPFGLTGTGRGAPGAARRSNLPSVIAATRRDDPEKIERAVLVSLPPSLTSSLAAGRPATGDPRTTHSLTGYLITTALPPETIAGAPSKRSRRVGSAWIPRALQR